MGDIITEYKETVDSDCTLPILTSSKTEGVILQEEHFGRKQQHDITGYNILPRNYCTYRNRSDGVDFTFNINKCCDKGIISKFYPVFSGKNSDVFFLSLVLNNSEEVVREIAYTCTGTGQKVLSFLDLQKMKVRVPNFDEQKEIAAYFESLDHLITLHQRKADKFEKIKKSMLERMFPKKGEKKPEIRFKGFNDDWEQRKCIDTIDISTEMVDPTTSEYYDMPHIAPGNIESFTGRILDNVKTVKEEQLISGKFRFRPGDVVYGKINPQLGKYFYASVDGLTSADAYVFKGKNGLTQKFLFSLLQTADFFKYSVSVSMRSGMPKINRDELNAYSFLAPNEEEQEQIGDFLLDIDNLITLHQSKQITINYQENRRKSMNGFNKESEFESALITALQSNGWEKQIIKNPID